MAKGKASAEMLQDRGESNSSLFSSLTWRRAGLADEGGSDAMPDAVGGEGGHGAAKPDAVIHRYISWRSAFPKRAPPTTRRIYFRALTQQSKLFHPASTK
jgi:hypothetical protein